MSLRCYIIDDEKHAIDVLSSFIERTPGLKLMGHATNPLVGLDEITQQAPPDLTFLDIDMPEFSGMELADMLRLYTRIIFTTAHPEYAAEAFDKQAVDYLLKPIPYKRFSQSILKAKMHIPGKGDEPLFIKGGQKGVLIKIDKKDILYIEGALNYIKFHLADGTTHQTYLSLNLIEQSIPPSQFLRIHKSFIINNARIKTIEGGHVIMENKERLSIGRAYRKQFLDHIQDLIPGSAADDPRDSPEPE